MSEYTYRFKPCRFDGVEDPEDYELGGFHPISIGDRFSKGRYRVIHKLGYGGSSTVWLARSSDSAAETLVTLRALRADQSSKPPTEIPALTIPEMLRSVLPPSVCIQTVEDHFFVQGPNGLHLFLVSPFAGPNLAAMSECPGRASGSRRLRGDLARKVAKEVAMALYHMHRAGVVHGDLTTSNILLSLSPHVLKWSDEELYVNFGKPKTDELLTVDGSPRPDNAPARLVAPIDNAKLTNPSFLQESVIVGDFGQSYAIASVPEDYQAGTAINYFAPEARFDNRAGLEADVWALGCAIFEIRSGSPLFETFFHTEQEALQGTVGILGHPPEKWVPAFEECGIKLSAEADDAEVFKFKSSIREQVRSIGEGGETVPGGDGPMIEAQDVRLREEEIDLLENLLEKMVRYCPEERIKMDEVIAHPWFAYVE